uniref:ATP synthase F0 subunit b n=1 Tax=Andalucia godoyi TaxID=505711 RepID=M4Q9C4_ANDGO|nr:ATP synthase F0 subunit b [Andalucia godoyi]AGH23961.1 ATP synthase F0 subunit b [Andalucia godoyi]
MIQNLLKDRIIAIILSCFLLVALVASEILVLDEEALVAGCFVLFVLFAYKNVGDVLANELDDRSSRIQKELQKSFDQKRELLLLEIENTQKQTSLLEDVKQIYAFSSQQMKIVEEKRKKAVLNRIASQANLQLRTLLLKEKEIFDSLQRDAIVSFSQAVLKEFQSNTPEVLDQKARLLDDAIEQLIASAPEQHL